MTLLGKILTFMNLVIAMAIVSWSVTLYTTRPSWFDAKPEGGYPAGKDPVNFAQLKEDIDALGRAATAASADWGAQRRRLEGLEQLRATRLQGYATRIDWARNGKPNQKDQAGFFEPVFDSRGLLDLSSVGAPIYGPDNLPLKGSNKLGTQTAADVREVVARSQEISKARDDFRNLGAVILGTETRLLKMGVIRDAVQSELFHLATFEVNVYETRETVLRRKKQLVDALAELGK